jgi:hypothetical protein
MPTPKVGVIGAKERGRKKERAASLTNSRHPQCGATSKLNFDASN